MKHLLFTLIFLPLFSQAQTISTIAGTGTAGYNYDGGLAIGAELYWPADVKTDGAGNVYIADFKNNRIRIINSIGVINTIAGNGIAGFSGDGGPATAAQLYQPSAIALDYSGNLYIADQYNNRVRMVNTLGIITTFAGTGAGAYSGDGGPATAARLNFPDGVATDVHGNLYISDLSNDRIRRVSPGGIITSFAGNGITGYTSDGGLADTTEIYYPAGMVTDAAGNLYFSDVDNFRVREINTAGIISTIAGNGTGGYSGDGAMATAAELYGTGGIAIDSGGNIYIADINNNRIRRINPSGIITTIAGNGTQGYSGDGGLAGQAELYHPSGVALDGSGDMYIADYLNDRIRMVTDVTGIRELPVVQTFSIYPNPAYDELNITASPISAAAGWEMIRNVIISNIIGQTVYIAPSASLRMTGAVQVDVSALPTGIYFVKVNGTTVKKFVKE